MNKNILRNHIQSPLMNGLTKKLKHFSATVSIISEGFITLAKCAKNNY